MADGLGGAGSEHIGASAAPHEDHLMAFSELKRILDSVT